MNGRWYEPLKRMLIKEFTQVFRDPKMSRMLWTMPIIQMLMFGYVVSLDVRHVPIVVYDLDNSVESRELIARFTGSKYFDVVAYVDDQAKAVDLLDRSKAEGILRIEHRFGALLTGRKSAPVQLIVDGTDSNTSSFVLDYASQIVSDYNQEVALKQAEDIVGPVPDAGGVNMVYRAWFNPNLDTRNFFLPGVIALIVMSITMSMSGMAVVREKEIGTIEQIWVTPISRLEFLLGKMIPFAVIGLLDAVIATLISIVWFDVPFNGSASVLMLGSALFIFCTLGVGLLVSTLSQTQQQAMMGTMFFNNPFMMLSGFTFPIANMPIVIQWLTFFDPVRYILVILRGVFLKGIGVSILWPQLLGLFLLGVGFLAIAVMRFKKTAA